MSLGASDRPSSYLFVSYAGVDRARVVQVADALRAAGVGIWIDLHDIDESASKALLASGIPRDAMMMIELDRPLFEYLRDRFPGVRVVNGDATRLVDIVRQQGVGPVSTVISGIPMVNMPLRFQRAIVEQSFAVLRPGGVMLQYSYSPLPPIRARRLGVEAELVRVVMRNLPPATVWRFSPKQANGHDDGEVDERKPA